MSAGTGGLITREDVLVAGSLIAGLASKSAAWELNDEAAIARDAWLAIGVDNNAEALVRALEASEGGRNLLREGFPQDIATAAQIDRFDVLPGSTWPDGSFTRHNEIKTHNRPARVAEVDSF